MVSCARWEVWQGYNPLSFHPETLSNCVREVLERDRSERGANTDIAPDPPVIFQNGKRPYGENCYYYHDLEDHGVPGIDADEAVDRAGDRRADFSEAARARIDEVHRRLYLTVQAIALHGTSA